MADDLLQRAVRPLARHLGGVIGLEEKDVAHRHLRGFGRVHLPAALRAERVLRARLRRRLERLPGLVRGEDLERLLDPVELLGAETAAFVPLVRLRLGADWMWKLKCLGGIEH